MEVGRITFLESIEKPFEAERKAREAADARVQAWQAKIKKGDCFRQSTPYGFDIYGEVLEEYDAEHMRNYRFCHCYSITCLVGKKLHIHISTMEALIARKTFEAVKKELIEGII